MSTAAHDQPAPRTRPRNRRQLIIEAAAVLFGERGYPNVSVADIATAVAVGPSAIYRHFPGKQAVLAEVLRAEMAEVSVKVTASAHSDQPWRSLAGMAVDHRNFGVLWEREARHLDDTGRHELVRGTTATARVITGLLSSLRPDLASDELEVVTWAVMGVLISPGFHHARVSDETLEILISDVCSNLASRFRIPVDTPASTEGHLTAVTNRREELLAAAIGLFAERGYHSVGIEDIAAATGLTGTSIYRHFETKNEILVAAMTRGAEWLRLDLRRALAGSGSPEDALRALVASYAGLVLEQPDLIGVLLSETAHLPDGDRRRIRQEQNDYISEWLHLLEALCPQEPAELARARIQALFTMVNTSVRSLKPADRSVLLPRLRILGESVLGLRRS